MLQRFRRKVKTGPGKEVQIHNYVSAGGYHVVFRNQKNEVDSRPVLYFALGTLKDGSRDQAVTPFVSYGNGVVKHLDPAAVIDYVYAPGQISEIKMKGESWKPTIK